MTIGQCLCESCQQAYLLYSVYTRVSFTLKELSERTDTLAYLRGSRVCLVVAVSGLF